MSGKWTPGPWVVTHNSWEVSTVSGFLGGKVSECQIDPDVDEDTQEKFELTKEANAHLIAAAPEMYDALQSIINDLPSSRDWLDPVIERIAMDALKKARGES